MSLYDEIMNIQGRLENIEDEHFGRPAYKVGHRDARHAAAELSLKYEKQIEQMRYDLVSVAITILSTESNPNIDELAHDLLGKYK